MGILSIAAGSLFKITAVPLRTATKLNEVLEQIERASEAFTSVWITFKKKSITWKCWSGFLISMKAIDSQTTDSAQSTAASRMPSSSQ
ncbi:hypothetical protein KSP39_PZI018833 [Platanthera zijinensis]|uniref:Uncharacterized protein n=1 Tax=Platanthera zijinensis TaxID=2320716 RepID=A0AAP0FYA0_9ASPA